MKIKKTILGKWHKAWEGIERYGLNGINIPSYSKKNEKG